MKISKSVKLVAAVALFAPVAMYAADGPILSGAVAMVKDEVTGPVRNLLILAEIVGGSWMYIMSKNPAVLIGTAVVAGVTTFGPTLLGA